MVTNGWKRSCRGAIALVAVVMMGMVVLAPGAGAGTRERPTYQVWIEWPGFQNPTSRCASDSSYVDAYQPPTRAAATVNVRIYHSATEAPGCKPVRTSSIEGQLKASTFWVTPDGQRGRLEASGWVSCTGAGCPSRHVKVHVDSWIRHDPTSSIPPRGAIAWGTVAVNGCTVTRGWSDNSETTMSYGPLDL